MASTVTALMVVSWAVLVAIEAAVASLVAVPMAHFVLGVAVAPSVFVPVELQESSTPARLVACWEY